MVSRDLIVFGQPKLNAVALRALIMLWLCCFLHVLGRGPNLVLVISTAVKTGC